MNKDGNKDFINPIDKDYITENPSTLTYRHHRGSSPIVPTKEGELNHYNLEVHRFVIRLKSTSVSYLNLLF